MNRAQPGERISFRVVETPEIPVLGAFFGWLATAPFALGAALAWGLEGGAASLAARLTILWGAAILAFLAGVRRGLGFRAPGGPSTATVATMLGLFLLALGALVVPWPAAATALLLAGYVALAVLDPVAARRHEAPLFFARLRPVQMLVPIAALAALGLRLILMN
jgi:hypothetical protein